MEFSVEIFAIVHLFLLGVSHVLRRDAWADFFIALSEKGRAGVFMHGFLSLWFGSIVVAFHNVWAGIPAALTAFGWLLVLKAVHCFVFPDAALRSLQKVSRDSSWRFIFPGVVYLTIGCLLAFNLGVARR